MRAVISVLILAVVANGLKVIPFGFTFSDLLELDWQIQNPFDYDEITVFGHFVLPKGEFLTVMGFYFQDYSRTMLPNGTELLLPVGNPGYQVRLLAAELGEHSYWFSANDSHGNHYVGPKNQFIVSPSNATLNGFVRVSEFNPYYFEFSTTKQTYFPVGENICWANNINQTTQPTTYLIDDWFQKVAINKGNYARLWIGPFDLLTIEDKLGTYNLANSWRVDSILNSAENFGIYLMFSLNTFNSYRSTPPYQLWDSNPYNAANGGPLSKPEQFFTNDQAKSLFKNRLKYIIARFSYSQNVFAWEFFNEVDLTDNYDSEIVSSWHQELSQFVRLIDPNQHLRTTSFSNPSGDPVIDSLTEIDFVQSHQYDPQDYFDTLGALCEKKLVYKKPHYIGETGIQDPVKATQTDPSGITVHHSLWTAIFSQCAGTGMYWWWDSYIDPLNLYSLFDGPRSFSELIPWNLHSWNSVTVNPDQPYLKTKALASLDTTLTLIWLQNTNFTYENSLQNVPIHMLNNGLLSVSVQEVHGLTLGITYRTRCWSTFDRRVLLDAQVNVVRNVVPFAYPPFKREMACLISQM